MGLRLRIVLQQAVQRESGEGTGRKSTQECTHSDRAQNVKSWNEVVGEPVNRGVLAQGKRQHQQQQAGHECYQRISFQRRPHRHCQDQDEHPEILRIEFRIVASPVVVGPGLRVEESAELRDDQRTHFLRMQRPAAGESKLLVSGFRRTSRFGSHASNLAWRADRTGGTLPHLDPRPTAMATANSPVRWRIGFHSPSHR